MQIKFVEISNILSIEKIRLDFDTNGLVLLDGWNYDDDSANGAGKSSIPNSIAYGLYDKIPRKISKSEIVRRGTKNGYVHVGVQVGNDILEVKRFRPKNTEYYINGVLENMTQDEFEDKIKISYSQFLICMYAAQTEGRRFLSLNDTDMKDFILRLMNLDQFLFKKKEVDLKIKELESSKIDIEKLIVSCNSKKSVYKEQLVDASSILEKIKSLSTIELEKKLAQVSSIKRPDTAKHEESKRKIADKIKKLDQIDNQININRALYKQVQHELRDLESYDFSDLLTCPACNEDFMPLKENPIHAKEHKNQVHKKIQTKKQQLQEIVTTINSATDTKQDRETLAELSRKIHNSEKTELQQYYDTMAQIKDLESKIHARKTTIESLNAQLNQQKEFKNKIKEINAIIHKAENKLKSVNGEIKLMSTVSLILAPSGAPAYILDAIIDVFNDKVSDYISLIWPNASYQLLAFKENKLGDIKAKFSNKLIIGGKNVSIGSLSGGEFKSLSIAIDFAIISIVESVFGLLISPIFLDEPFEGLDQSNRERVISLLDKIAIDRQIWIIDHASESKSMFSHIVKIEKRSGISDII